jgi:hypothetical protein
MDHGEDVLESPSSGDFATRALRLQSMQTSPRRVRISMREYCEINKMLLHANETYGQGMIRIGNESPPQLGPL